MLRILPIFAGIAPLLFAGCQLVPDVAHQPIVHNPFPQLSRVAVAPFFNHSDEATVDGRQFALAYYSELQDVPGFEVVPLAVVEEAMLEHQIALHDPGEARRLAQILGVDAVVVGAVTDFTPYYPPQCGIRVEWYAANAGFHPIPPGYGLPWGTPDEEFIPAPLVFEAEMALATAQLKTQTPNCEEIVTPLPPPPENSFSSAQASTTDDDFDPFENQNDAKLANFQQSRAKSSEELPLEPIPAPQPSSPDADKPQDGDRPVTLANVIPNWPDERGFIPPGPRPVLPPCQPQSGPVITHTRIYRGNDAEFTEALASYYHFRDEARFGGWQSYLDRSEDFIRFCCHLHISETLSARGGAGETRVVWRWSDNR